MGKLIVVEGLDGSGKSTQTQELFKELYDQGRNVRLISFPNYQSKTGELVAMYLNGEYGNSADSVNAYAASTFYAIDRYSSYVKGWKEFYAENDSIVIASRYTTANAIHQLAKLEREEWDSYLTWLYDFEFKKLGLPKPDKVLFLDVRPDLTQALIEKRTEQTGQQKDIHEKDMEFVLKCYKAANYSCDKLSWTKIECYNDDEILSVEDIKAKLIEEVTLLLDRNGD